jgi:hypothetical protein
VAFRRDADAASTLVLPSSDEDEILRRLATALDARLRGFSAAKAARSVIASKLNLT